MTCGRTEHPYPLIHVLAEEAEMTTPPAAKPQSIIDTHRAVLDLARREALEVTVERDGQDDVRGTVAELDDVIVLVRVRRIHDGREYAPARQIAVDVATIDRLTLHA